jgi:hypothetical protein
MGAEGLVARPGMVLARTHDSSVASLLRVEPRGEHRPGDTHDNTCTPPQWRIWPSRGIATGTSHTQRVTRTETSSGFRAAIWHYPSVLPGMDGQLASRCGIHPSAHRSRGCHHGRTRRQPGAPAGGTPRHRSWVGASSVALGRSPLGSQRRQSTPGREGWCGAVWADSDQESTRACRRPPC